MRTALLVAGLVLLVVGAQGLIRLLVDHENAGILGWLPGGFTAQLIGYVLATAVGIWLAARNTPSRAKSNEDR